MKRQEVKKLIEQYFSDGFDNVDLLTPYKTINISKDRILRFTCDELVISFEKSIPYEDIQSIEI